VLYLVFFTLSDPSRTILVPKDELPEVHIDERDLSSMTPLASWLRRRLGFAQGVPPTFVSSSVNIFRYRENKNGNYQNLWQ
jgi:hypothetical protein